MRIPNTNDKIDGFCGSLGISEGEPGPGGGGRGHEQRGVHVPVPRVVAHGARQDQRSGARLVHQVRRRLRQPRVQRRVRQLPVGANAGNLNCVTKIYVNYIQRLLRDGLPLGLQFHTKLLKKDTARDNFTYRVSHKYGNSSINRQKCIFRKKCFIKSFIFFFPTSIDDLLTKIKLGYIFQNYTSGELFCCSDTLPTPGIYIF